MPSLPGSSTSLLDSQPSPEKITWRFLLKKYMLDWFVICLLVLIDIGLNVIHPNQRYINSEMLKYLTFPLKHNSVPVIAIPVIALVVPITFFVIFFIFRKDIADLHQALLGLFYALALSAVVVDALKNGVGRPRPNFFLRCFPDGSTVFGPDGNVKCTGTESVIREGYKSFPSGHSSWSFAGLSYLSFYLAGKLSIFSKRGHIAYLLPVGFPLVAATAVGVSRICDYWHNVSDVVTGALIGIVCALTFYRFIYPRFSDEHCDKPLISVADSRRLANSNVQIVEDVETGTRP